MTGSLYLCSIISSLVMVGLLMNHSVAFPTSLPSSEISQQVAQLTKLSQRLDAEDLPNPKYLTYLAGDLPVAQTDDQKTGVSRLMLSGFGLSRGRKAIAANANVQERIKDVAPFASIPYCGNADVLMQLTCGPKCLLPQVRKAKMVRVVEQDSNLVVIADRPERNEVVVSFRGTANEANWLDNLELDRVPWPFNQPTNATSSTFTVHKGFTDAYRTVRNETMVTIQQRLADNPNRTLLLTGHSLGGALAAMAALDVVAGNMIKASRMDLMTYGAPRIGDQSFGSVMKGAGFRTMQRVVSGRDLIPHVPARAKGYQQLDGEVFIKSTSGGKDDGAQVLACNGPEDPTCSNSRVPLLSVVAHGRFLSGSAFFGLGGCKTDSPE